MIVLRLPILSDIFPKGRREAAMTATKTEKNIPCWKKSSPRVCFVYRGSTKEFWSTKRSYILYTMSNVSKILLCKIILKESRNENDFLDALELLPGSSVSLRRIA